MERTPLSPTTACTRPSKLRAAPGTDTPGARIPWPSVVSHCRRCDWLPERAVTDRRVRLQTVERRRLRRRRQTDPCLSYNRRPPLCRRADPASSPERRADLCRATESSRCDRTSQEQSLMPGTPTSVSVMLTYRSCRYRGGGELSRRQRIPCTARRSRNHKIGAGIPR
jgi:hypothetical protein